MLGIVCAYIFFDNSRVNISSYNIYSKKINQTFDGYKINLISDFHNSSNYDKIIKRVSNSNPNIIVLVGDIFNMEDEKIDNVGKLIDGLNTANNVYFVSGNNETWSKKEYMILDILKSKNVNIINNAVIPIEYKNNKINLIGYKDIIYSDDVMRYDILEKELEILYNKVENKDLFNILLFHRGNLFETVAKTPFDLVLTGHTHGGQINLPYIKEEILLKKFNNKKYSKGYYRLGNSQMVLSGGVEKNFNNIRLFNTPEVTEIILKRIK
jgi:predicted MPP superfamily phosphohydrolase